MDDLNIWQPPAPPLASGAPPALFAPPPVAPTVPLPEFPPPVPTTRTAAATTTEAEQQEQLAQVRARQELHEAYMKAMMQEQAPPSKLTTGGSVVASSSQQQTLQHQPPTMFPSVTSVLVLASSSSTHDQQGAAIHINSGIASNDMQHIRPAINVLAPSETGNAIANNDNPLSLSRATKHDDVVTLNKSYDDVRRYLSNNPTEASSSLSQPSASSTKPAAAASPRTTKPTTNFFDDATTTNTATLFSAESYAMLAQVSAMEASQHAAYYSNPMAMFAQPHQPIKNDVSLDIDGMLRMVSEHAFGQYGRRGQQQVQGPTQNDQTVKKTKLEADEIEEDVSEDVNEDGDEIPGSTEELTPVQRFVKNSQSNKNVVSEPSATESSSAFGGSNSESNPGSGIDNTWSNDENDDDDEGETSSNNSDASESSGKRDKNTHQQHQYDYQQHQHNHQHQTKHTGMKRKNHGCG
jgi:hypothetical protein